MSDGGGHGKRRGGHDEEHEEHENHERWLVSYADMMTLLMVLFIVMFAISQVDQKKFMALKTGLSAGFGAPVAMLSGADALLDVGGHVAPDTVNLAGVAGNRNADPEAQIQTPYPNVEMSSTQVAQLAKAMQKASVKQEVENLKKAEEELKKALQVAGVAKGATFRFDERGLVTSIATDKVLFDSGNATLRPGGVKILAALAPTLRKLPNRLSIDGHTDSRPITTSQFPSNWELSTARATGVLRYLASAQRLPATRMMASGFADTKPLVAGTSARANDTNRRVEIVVLARLDNSAGRAVSELGNASETPAVQASGEAKGTSGAAASASHEPAAAQPTAAQATGTKSHPKSASSGSSWLLGPGKIPANATTPTETSSSGG